MNMPVQRFFRGLQIILAFHAQMRQEQHGIHIEQQILATSFKRAEMLSDQRFPKLVRIAFENHRGPHRNILDLSALDLMFQRADDGFYFRQLRHHFASYQSEPAAHSTVRGTSSFIALHMPSVTSFVISSSSSFGTSKISSS